MQPNARALRDGVLVNDRMDNSGSGIYRRQAAPIFLLRWFQCIKSRCLVGEVGTCAVFSWSDYVIPRVRKRIGVEAAIIVPLRPDAQDPMMFIVGKAENMGVMIGRRRMYPVGAVQSLATPPAARSKKVVWVQAGGIFENDKAASRHGVLERIDDRLRGWHRTGQIKRPYSRADRHQWPQCRPEVAHNRHIFLVQRWYLLSISRQCSLPQSPDKILMAKGFGWNRACCMLSEAAAFCRCGLDTSIDTIELMLLDCFSIFCSFTEFIALCSTRDTLKHFDETLAFERFFASPRDSVAYVLAAYPCKKYQVSLSYSSSYIS